MTIRRRTSLTLKGLTDAEVEYLLLGDSTTESIDRIRRHRLTRTLAATRRRAYGQQPKRCKACRVPEAAGASVGSRRAVRR